MKKILYVAVLALSTPALTFVTQWGIDPETFFVDFDNSLGKEDPYHNSFFKQFCRVRKDKNSSWFRFIKPMENPVCLLKNLKENYSAQKGAYPEDSRDVRIPPIFHQIWLGPKPFPEKYARWQHTWQSIPGTTYKLWTDEDLKDFPLINRDLYEQETNYGAKSDIARLEILYQEGGVYVDTDFECIKPEAFAFLNQSYDFYCGITPLDSKALVLANGLIGSIPRHPILRECLENISLHASYERDKSMQTVMRGPGLLTIAASHHLCHDQYRNIVLPPTFFYPIGSRQLKTFSVETFEEIKQSCTRPETIAIHYWEGSWQPPKKIVPPSQNLQFIILITSYNNETRAEENLESVCHQDYPESYKVVCINDCSTDKTGKIMDEYVKKNNLEDRVTIIHNTVRRGALENIYTAVHTFPDEAIIVSVDGDDKLIHNGVLMRLAQEYSNPDVWMTYGSCTLSYKLLDRGLPEKVFHEKKIRKYPFATTHLRTFKAALFKKIKKEDLMYEGKFFPMAWDLAILFPMLEMAGPVDAKSKIHVKQIKDVLYFYFEDNPLSDNKINKPLQIFLDKYIRTLTPYDPLGRL